jgi:hypothetical protein
MHGCILQNGMSSREIITLLNNSLHYVNILETRKKTKSKAKEGDRLSNPKKIEFKPMQPTCISSLWFFKLFETTD